jgi:DNA replication protein DnaC
MENCSWDEIELTQEEIDTALRQARKAKYQKIKEQAYWDKVRAPKKYQTTTPEELYNLVKLHPQLVIDSDNEEVIIKLSHYFSNSAEMDKYGLNPEKGILLAGPTGCGKTTLMKLYANNMHQSYSVVSCRKVGYDFAELGFTAIENYSSKIYVIENIFGHKEYGTCFDDLGTDEERRRYGDKVNAMTEILLERYDKVPFKFTHLTTNLTADQIEEAYGPRVRSRLREMFNFIAYNPKSSDRRKS